MAQMDTGDPTITEHMAERCDAYRIALTLIDERTWPEGEGAATPHDVFSLARWIYGDGES